MQTVLSGSRRRSSELAEGYTDFTWNPLALNMPSPFTQSHVEGRRAQSFCSGETHSSSVTWPRYRDGHSRARPWVLSSWHVPGSAPRPDPQGRRVAHEHKGVRLSLHRPRLPGLRAPRITVRLDRALAVPTRYLKLHSATEGAGQALASWF